MVDGLGSDVLRGEKVERPLKEVVEFVDWSIGFCGLRETVAKIPGGEGLGVIASDTEPWMDEMGVAECVKIRFPGWDPDDFGTEEQIEHTGECALRAQRSFGHCLDDAVRLRAPGHD